ncbi:MAG: CHAT domain-containing protein, partial [Flavobacteriales bacterium]
TPSVIKQLKEELNGTSLLLRMNERLVHIPWELLYTGDSFLCLKFNMGRVVSTRQKVSSRGIRKLEMPLRMLIIANPTGDLESARSEGEELQQLGKNALEKISTVLLGKDASSQKLADEIGNFDLCHYAGHAVYDDTNPEKSRWLLNNDQLDAGAIGGLGGKRPLPALIFSNACSSGHSGQWVLHEDFNEHVFGMANAFLLSGTRHYIGTFRELVDGPGQVFSQQFYERLLAGASVGHALRLARQEIVDRYGEDSVIWASYLLYGAPSFVYFPQENVTRDREATKPATASDQLSDVTSAANEEKRPLLWGGAAIVIVLLLTIVYFLVSRSEAPPVVAPPQVVVVPAKPSVDMNEAVALYKKGAYEAAIPILQARLQEDASDRVAMAFLRESQQRLAIQSSEAEQHKIDDLAKQLIERHRAQPKGQGPTVSDEWTSRPLTVALLDLVHKGEAVLTTGKEEYIPIGLGNGLQEQGRIRLVDRALLAQVMRELQLGSSDLANPSTQLKIGRILAAKTFVAGSVLGMDQQVQVNLRIIDTETTEVLGQVSELYSKNDSIFDVVKRLADDMAVRILQAYPIRCRVASGSQDGQLELNAGSNIGLKTGMLLTDRNGHSEVEVVRVEGNRAYAKGESLAVDTMLQQKL